MRMNYMERIAEILYPNGDTENEWTVDDIERIAEVVGEWMEKYECLIN